MNARRRAVAAALLSLSFVLELAVPASLSPAAAAVKTASALPSAPTRVVSPPLARVPKRSELDIATKEHEGGGSRVNPGLHAIVHDPRHAPPDPHAAPAANRSSARRHVTAVRHTTSVVGGSGCGATPSSPPILSQTDLGTGINPWWRYVEGSMPGVGRYYVNVANQNLILQSDDMDIPNAGIDLTFRRTANSMSYHDVLGSDGATPTEVGNSWTSTFDAHLSGNAAGGLSVSEIDGARFDYVSDGQGHWIPPAGQHAALTTADGGATYQWTKKTGTSYIFAGPYVNQGNAYEGYNGRLLKISGRNSHTSITLTYLWTCGDAASNANLAEIDAATQSGMTAKLYFADFNGHRLLSKLVWPDGATTVTYEYSNGGVLLYVHKPAPNSSGMLATEGYVAGAAQLFESPRYVASNGADGGYIAFTVSASRRVTGIQSVGVMNGIPPDGTNTVLQPGVSTTQSQYNYISIRNVSAGSNEFSDSNGHDSYYYFDSGNRITEITNWTNTQWLATFQVWSTANNRTATVDYRGNETDYAYDADGNLLATAAPSPTSGAFRPTTLYAYDSSHNVVAFCDPLTTHSLGMDWNSTSSPPGVCLQSAAATRFNYVYPSYEPFGELQAYAMPATESAPNGYTANLYYAASRQGGTDLGLVTSIQGDPLTQPDSLVPSRVPAAEMWYDNSGWLGCYSTGVGISVLVHDVLGRVISASDPDDGSQAGICSKSSGIPSWNTTTTTAYNPDGSVAATQSPTERAAGVSTTYVYDSDGNVTSQSMHYGCTTSTCAAAVTKYWFDGADRLIEKLVPLDTNNSMDVPWLERYIYDLTGGGNASSISGLSVAAHGNLYETQKWSPSGWLDTRIAAFDALDRQSTSYAFAPCPAGTGPGAVYCSGQTPYATVFAWDIGSQLGLLGSVTDGLNEVRSYAYDNLGRTLAVQYSGDNGVTPAMTYTYDADNNLTQATAGALGSESYTYGPRRELKQVAESSGLGSTTTSYNYYGDSAPKSVTVSSPLLNQSSLYQYTYGADGRISTESFGIGGATVAYAYTPGGRITAVTDFATTPSQQRSYDTYGRLSQYVIPAGAYSMLSYDAEGNLTGYNAYGGESVGMSYNARGNLIAQSFSPNPITNGYSAWPAFQYSNIQGATVQSASEQWDGRTGNVLNLGQSAFSYDRIGRLTQVGSVGVFGASFTYDAENRLTHGDSTKISGPGNCGSGGRQTQGMRAGGNVRYVYGPDGQVAQDVSAAVDGSQTTRQWHWNGSKLMYTVSSASLDGVAADGIGVLSPQGSAAGLTVFDLDLDGYEASRHNTTGFGSWTAPNPFGQKCVYPQSLPPSSGFADPAVSVSTVQEDQADDGNNTITSSGSARLASAIMRTTAPQDRGSKTVRHTSDFCRLDPDSGRLVKVEDPYGNHIDSCAQNGSGGGPVELIGPTPGGSGGGSGGWGPPGHGGGFGKPLPKIGGVTVHYRKPSPLARFLALLISFNSQHAMRAGHFGRFPSLQQAAIEDAIRAQVQGYGSQVGSHWGWVEVDGQSIEYRVWELPDGSFRISTYFPTDAPLSNARPGPLDAVPEVPPEVIVP